MSNETHLLAAVYPDRDHAKTIFDMLEQMRRADNIHIEDAALVTKEADGKIKVEETKDLTTKKGLKRGALIAGTFGLIFPPSLIASALVGGAAGAVAGKIRDTGIKSDEMRKLAEDLEPGKAILVVLSNDDSLVKVQNALSAYEGELVITAIDQASMDEINRNQVIAEASNTFE